MYTPNIISSFAPNIRIIIIKTSVTFFILDHGPQRLCLPRALLPI